MWILYCIFFFLTQDYSTDHPVLTVPPSHTCAFSCVQQGQKTSHHPCLHLSDSPCMYHTNCLSCSPVIVFGIEMYEINCPFCLWTPWHFTSCTCPQVLLAISFSWLICYILTIYNVLPIEPHHYGYMARTDLKGDIISQAPWFTFPYPGKRRPNAEED